MTLQAAVDAWTSRYIKSKEASLARLMGVLSPPDERRHRLIASLARRLLPLQFDTELLLGSGRGRRSEIARKSPCEETPAPPPIHAGPTASPPPLSRDRAEGEAVICGDIWLRTPSNAVVRRWLCVFRHTTTG